MKANHSCASVLARLLNLAKETGDDYNLVLIRFGLERIYTVIAEKYHAMAMAAHASGCARVKRQCNVASNQAGLDRCCVMQHKLLPRL